MSMPSCPLVRVNRPCSRPLSASYWLIFSALQFCVGRDEPVAVQTEAPVQRVIQLGEDAWCLADLEEVAPLRARRAEPAAVVIDLHVEGAVASEIGEEIDADTEVVRAPRFFLQVEDQAVALGGLQQMEVGPGVVATGRQAPRVALGLLLVERLSGGGFEDIGKAFRIGEFGALESHERQLRRLAFRGRVRQAPLRVSARFERQGGQSGQLGPHTGLALGDQFPGALEITGTEFAQRGCDQHVLRVEAGDAALHVLFGQDVDHLGRQPAHRRERVPAGERRADVHCNHHIGAHGACDVHRKVVDQAAIAEDPAIGLGGGEHARHAHARSQGERQIALLKNHRRTRLQVRGDGAKRDGELGKVAHAAHRQRVAAQQALEAPSRTAPPGVRATRHRACRIPAPATGRSLPPCAAGSAADGRRGWRRRRPTSGPATRIRCASHPCRWRTDRQ